MALGLFDAVQACAVVGVLLSVYAVHVETSAEEMDDYVAACDINTWISCSKVFQSKYGKMLSCYNVVEHGSPWDLPNAVYGVVIYSAVALLRPIAYALLHHGFVVYAVAAAAAASVASSVFLGYVLVAILHEVCLVCCTLYVVNAAWLAYAVRDVRRWHASSLAKSKSA
jgi:vitamin-K-epoxide reductase (warfarin-sensitive)